jgi:hypothetical protein
MSGHTDYAQNKINDAIWRGQALGAPATYYFGLICSSKGARANSTAYVLNDTITVQIGGKYQLYKCTTAGTTAASQPGGYAGAVSEAITDGTAVFTEQSAALDAGTYAEVSASGTGYARVGVASSLANFAGTQSAGSTTASTGTSGTTSNNGVITFPAPTGQWHPNGGLIVGVVAFDAATGGNPWWWGMLAAGKNVNSGDSAPSIAAGALTSQIGS